MFHLIFETGMFLLNLIPVSVFIPVIEQRFRLCLEGMKIITMKPLGTIPKLHPEKQQKYVFSLLHYLYFWGYSHSRKHVSLESLFVMQKDEREQTEMDMKAGMEIGEILTPCGNTLVWEASNFFLYQFDTLRWLMKI